MRLPDASAPTGRHWRPRTLSSVTARSLNLIAQQAHRLPLSLGEQLWEVTLVPRGAPVPFPEAWLVNLRWGEGEFLLAIPLPQARRWLAAQFPGLALDSLPDAFAQAVLCTACKQALAALEAQGVGVVTMEGDGRPWPADLGSLHALELQLRHGPHVLQGLLMTRSAGLLQLASQLAALPSHPGVLSVDAMPSRWCAEVGFTWLPLSQWRALQAGDAILIDRPLLSADGELWLGCGDWGLRVAWRDGTLRVRERLKQGGWRMKTDNDLQNAGELDTLAQLPLRVSFDLGDIALTVGEVASLQVGQVIDLGLPLTDAVHIRINGARVGFGELVDIDGQLGVLVRSLAAPDVAEPGLLVSASSGNADTLPARGDASAAEAGLGPEGEDHLDPLDGQAPAHGDPLDDADADDFFPADGYRARGTA